MSIMYETNQQNFSHTVNAEQVKMPSLYFLLKNNINNSFSKNKVSKFFIGQEIKHRISQISFDKCQGQIQFLCLPNSVPDSMPWIPIIQIFLSVALFWVFFTLFLYTFSCPMH